MILAWQIDMSGGVFAWIPGMVLLSYLSLLLAFGWLGYRRRSEGEEDYYLAGRSQGWMISSLTIMATFFSSFALLGAPGMVYREGVVFALVSLNVPVAGFCIYLLGSRIQVAGKLNGYVTQADMLCDHYRSPVMLRLMIVLVGLLYVVPYVMMQFKAGGELASVLFPHQANAFQIGAIGISAVTAIYIMIGGMRSVAWTDALQCLLLTLGMLLAGAAMVYSLGGWSGYTNALRSLPESSLKAPGNTGFWSLPMLFSVCILMPLGGIIQPAQWMRFYSARDRQSLRRSALIFVVVLTGCFLFGIMLVGLGGQALFPLQFDDDGQVSPHADVSSYDQILVVVMQRKLPMLLGPALGGVLTSVLIVAIMAAAMSTADSNLHALSALATRDVYDRFIRPTASDRERVWVGRMVILGATALALCLVLTGSRAGSPVAGFMEMIVGLALFAVAFSVQLLPITLDVLFIRCGTRAGACAGLAAGLICAFVFTSLFSSLVSILAPSPLDWVDNIAGQAKSLFPVHASLWGLMVNVLVFVLISRVSHPIAGGSSPRRSSGSRSE